MKVFNFVLLVIISSFAFHTRARASSPSTLQIFDYAVISAENIRSRQCDFQGSAVAGGSAEFYDFALGNELTPTEKMQTQLLIGGHLSFTNGSNDLSFSSVDGDAKFNSVVQNERLQVGGQVDFTKVTLPNTLAVGPGHPPSLVLSDILSIEPIAAFSKKAEIQGLLNEMARRSACYASLKPNPLGWQGSPGRYQFVVFRAIPRQTLQVFNVEKSTWDAANGVKIIGDSSMQFIINVQGANSRIVQKGFVLEGGVKLNQILLHFPQATELTITRSGTDQGVPSVLAPGARLSHSSNLIRGSVLVRDYDGWFDQCGQVNSHFTDRFKEPSVCL